MPSPSPSDAIGQILSPSRQAWVVEPGIWSVLPRATPPQRYDARVKLYDLVVGNGTYNRLLWGSSASKYSRFSEASVSARDTGWHLDAGCGSLLFSATAYARHPDRPIVLVDHSLGMLRQARSRLERLEPARNAPLLLLQADLLDLPFRKGIFDTVLSMGILHLFSDPERVMGEMGRVLGPAGILSLSSLVLGRPVGDAYLRLLHLAGEVARPRSATEVRSLVRRHIPGFFRLRRKGNMLFIEAGRR